MPDLLLTNARIWTGDDANPWADAAVIEDGRFSFVGRESDINVPAATNVLDAEGRLGAQQQPHQGKNPPEPQSKDQSH